LLDVRYAQKYQLSVELKSDNFRSLENAASRWKAAVTFDVMEAKQSLRDYFIST